MPAIGDVVAISTISGSCVILDFSAVPGAAPAITIEPETNYDLVPILGTGSRYAREDHSHGSPPDRGIVPLPASTIVSELLYDQGAAVGTSSIYARGDHTHGSPEIVTSYQRFQNRGTAGVRNFGSYYTANCVTGHNDPTNAYWSGNYLYAIPFVIPTGGIIDVVKMYFVDDKPAWTTRIGIYRSTSTTNIYPNDLITTCGTISQAIGWQSISSLSIAIDAEDVYWFAILGNGTGNSVIAALNYCSNIMGTDDGIPYDNNTWCYVTYAYGALPATFPSSATKASTMCPTIRYHLSS